MDSGQQGVALELSPEPNTRGNVWHAPSRKADVRLPGKGIAHFHGARPVHLIITMIK
jgi:hypothetical protein